MTTTERVSTPELRPGDLVLTHGMRVRLEPDPTTWADDRTGSTVYAWRGRVENLDQVLAAGYVPASFVRDGSWTVQGNDLATWIRESSPATITVTLPYTTSAMAEAEIRAVLASAGPEISDCVAVTIASWWQSPGSIGRHLAALASGAPVAYGDLADDIHMTRRVARDERDRRGLDCLSTWALDRTHANTRDYSV